MSKFKIGDKVVVCAASGLKRGGLAIGDKGEVVETEWKDPMTGIVQAGLLVANLAVSGFDGMKVHCIIRESNLALQEGA